MNTRYTVYDTIKAGFLSLSNTNRFHFRQRDLRVLPRLRLLHAALAAHPDEDRGQRRQKQATERETDG